MQELYSSGKPVLEELLEELLELFKSSGLRQASAVISLMTSVGKAPSKNSGSRLRVVDIVMFQDFPKVSVLRNFMESTFWFVVLGGKRISLCQLHLNLSALSRKFQFHFETNSPQTKTQGLESVVHKSSLSESVYTKNM